MTDFLSIDFETASLADLKKVGAATYAKHPSTRVLCMAWAFNHEPVQVWREGEVFPQRVLDHVARGGLVRGWNLSFEFWVWNYVLRRLNRTGALAGFPALKREQLEDTMAAAAYWGLPLSLDQAGQAAGVSITKDKDGHALMMRMCRPRGYDKDTGEPTWWHKDDPDRFDRLCAYCRRDVETERAVQLAIPPLPDDEKLVWQADHRINTRGVALDTELVQKLRDLATDASKRVNVEIQVRTNGEVKTVTSSAALLAWLRNNTAYPYDNLRKDTVAARLEEPGVSDAERAVLELRADGAKTSAAKLDSMLLAGGMGQGRYKRVSGLLQYYGAFRTGRWAGRLIQPQNMPRGSIKNIESALDFVLAGGQIDFVEALFGPAMQVVSAGLRGCIVAEPGNKLVVADFSQIEARVIAWLAGQQDALNVFRSGQDIYVYTANQIGSNDRQLGKVLVLACGFGMSASKFRDTAATYGLDLDMETAERAVGAWRRTNSQIVNLWWDYDRVARDVIARGPNSKPVKVGEVQFAMWQGHLLVRLPSGRTLCYRDAKLIPGDRGMDISYMGVNQYTRKWERTRTYGGKIAENVTQAVARDVMRDAVLAAENKHDIPVILLVHDEIIGEVPEADADAKLQALLSLMHAPPDWALGLPVAGTGWLGDRYKK